MENIWNNMDNADVLIIYAAKLCKIMGIHDIPMSSPQVACCFSGLP